MKIKTFNFIIASMFLLVLATSFTSATLTLTNINVPVNSTHGSTISLQVNLTADDNYTSLSWTESNSAFDLSNLPTSIEENEVLALSLELNIPENEAPGVFSAILKVVNDSVESNDLTISTIILENKELSVTSATLSGDSTIITISNEGNVDLDNIILTSSTGNFEINFSENNFDLDKGTSNDVTVNLVSEDSDLIGTNTLTITATAEGTSSTGTITRGAGFCEGIPTLEKLKINDISFSNKGISTTIFGDDNQWYPFEEIEVTIEVENDGRYDMVDIALIWGLYDNKEKRWVIDPEEEKEFDLDGGDAEEITFSFEMDDNLEVNLEDLSNGEDYSFYVRAEGKIDDSDSSNDNEKTCVSEDEDIELIIEDDFVILANLDLVYDVSCGSQLTITPEIWNIGSDKQKDFYVRVSNSLLGINQEFDIDSLKSFDSEDLMVSIDIPENAEKRNYDLRWEVYDKDDDLYESDNTESEFFTRLNVAGNCEVKPTLDVSAKLQEAIAGKEAKIIVEVTNLGDSTQSFDLSLASYNLWVESYELSTDYLVIRGGETKEVVITMLIKKDISGINEFDFLLTSEDGIETQPIEVEVVKHSGFLGFTGFSIGGNVYASGLIFLILILVIVILVLLIVRKLRK